MTKNNMPKKVDPLLEKKNHQKQCFSQVFQACLTLIYTKKIRAGDPKGFKQ